MNFPPNVFPLLSFCLHSCIPSSFPPSSGRKRKAERGKQGVFLTLGNLRSLQVKVKYLGEVDFEKSRTFPIQKISPAWEKLGAGEIERSLVGPREKALLFVPQQFGRDQTLLVGEVLYFLQATTSQKGNGYQAWETGVQIFSHRFSSQGTELPDNPQNSEVMM